MAEAIAVISTCQRCKNQSIARLKKKPEGFYIPPGWLLVWRQRRSQQPHNELLCGACAADYAAFMRGQELEKTDAGTGEARQDPEEVPVAYDGDSVFSHR